MRHRLFGGEPRSALLRLGSSYRSRTAAETIAAAETLMPTFGISRVTDITRMDRLGLPVFASVRPRSQTLRVHAGKGVLPIEARAGALMEAVEHAAAEPHRSAWTATPLTVADLVAQFDDGLRLVDFGPRFGVPITAAQVVATVECEDLHRRRPVGLPADLVFFPWGADTADAPFGATTNGLASGNTLEEATLHALLEVMERDATSMNKPRDVSQWLAPEDLPEPFRALAAHWRAIGVDLSVRYVPNAFALPCFEAGLHERDSASVNLAAGSGLHLDRGIALARAICEAAQSRLSHIHGGRDDITDFYDKYSGMSRANRTEAEAAVIRAMFNPTRRIDFAAIPHEPSRRRSLAAVLDDVLQRLSRQGFVSVFRYRFGLDLNGLCVVKVIVPGCENIEDDPKRIGPRLLKQILLAHA